MADAWFPARVHDDPMKEEEVPLKRKKIASLDRVSMFRLKL